MEFINGGIPNVLPGAKPKRKYRKPGLTAAGSVPSALTNLAALPDETRVTIIVLEGVTGFSNATIHRRMKTDPDFPKPIRDGRCTRFRVGDIRRYLENKAAQS
ncbi:MAG: hypothetical protein IPI02_03970 [Sterolibacteriaceae bacterium]|nr:hypothetical protein [Sterolibacteriaceae bacterium]